MSDGRVWLIQAAAQGMLLQLLPLSLLLGAWPCWGQRQHSLLLHSACCRSCSASHGLRALQAASKAEGLAGTPCSQADGMRLGHGIAIATQPVEPSGMCTDCAHAHQAGIVAGGAACGKYRLVQGFCMLKVCMHSRGLHGGRR